jgi:hypothetical protein
MAYPTRSIFRLGLGFYRDWDSQNGNPSKINPEKVACFSSPKNDRQLTSFHQQSTTNSPSKNHVLHLFFAKTPSKNAGYPSGNNYCKKTIASQVVFWLLPGDGDATH